MFVIWYSLSAWILLFNSINSFRYYEDSEADNDYKIVSSQHPTLARSLSQPSLARSASEFTERWVAPSRYDTASEFTSPEGTPKSQRSTRIQPLHIPRGSGERSSLWQASTSSHVAREPGASGQVVSQQYRSEASSSFRQNWMGDNFSEDSYK